MAKPVRSVVQEQSFVIQVNNKQHTVHLDKYGLFRLNGGYRGDRLDAQTIDSVIQTIQDRDAEAKAKAEAAKARKAAQSGVEVKALLRHGDGALETIIIRGRHAGTSKLLVTRADGSKESLSPYVRLLRELSGEEASEVAQVLNEQVKAAEDVELVGGVTTYEAAREFTDIVLDVTYDKETKTFTTEYRGEVYAGPTAHSVESAVVPALVAKKYPFKVAEGEVLPTSQETPSWGVTLFPTAEAAQLFLDRLAVQEEVDNRVQKVLSTYAFDTSIVKG